MKIICTAVALTVASLHATAAETAPAPATPAAASVLLKVGDAAPAIKFGKFFKGDVVTELAADKTYVIECWATWCGPCIAAFPHLSEIAKATAGKATIIGVNIMDKKTPEQIQTFVDGQADRMSYAVTMDVDNNVSKNWMQAAGRKGIPAAFVVSKGKIAWMGHPALLASETFLGLSEGTFTVEDLAQCDTMRSDLLKALDEKVFGTLTDKDIKGTLSSAEEMMKAKPATAGMLKAPLEKLHLRVLVNENPADAVKQVIGNSGIIDFLGAAQILIGSGKLNAENAAALDASASERIAKLDPADTRTKVYCAIFRADLLASQSKFAEAAAFIESAKPDLDPKAATFLDQKIAAYKAQAAGPASN